MKMKLDRGILIIADCDGMQLNIIKSWNKMEPPVAGRTMYRRTSEPIGRTCKVAANHRRTTAAHEPDRGSS